MSISTATTGRLSAAAALLIVWTIGAAYAEVRAEDHLSTGSDAQTVPRRHGGGFEFRRHLPMIDNPYCEITTYVLPQFDEQASSTIDAKDLMLIS